MEGERQEHMDTEREPVSGSGEGWGSARGDGGHSLARYRRPALVLLSLFLVWQLYGMLFGGGSPRVLKYLHEDTFLVARVDLDAVMDGDLFESIVELAGVEQGWEEFDEEFEEAFGVRPKDLRSLTIALSAQWPADPEVLLFLETRKELDLERIGEQVEGFPVTMDDDGGDGANARLRVRLDRGGSYRVLVSELSGGRLEGRLRGTLGDERVDSPISGRYPRPGEGAGEGSFGPYQAKAGDLVDVYTQCSGDPYLTLQWDPPASDEEEGIHAIYTGTGDGVICRLASKLYLICEGPQVAQAVRAGEGSELDRSMRHLLDDVDWSAEASFAFDISALPTAELEEVMEEGLEMLGRSTRDARLMRDIEGLTGAVDLKSDSVRYELDVLCEDREVADDLLDGLEDALEAIEELPGLPRAVDDFIESFSLRARGKSVTVKAAVTEEMLEDLFDGVRMEESADADDFSYKLF